MRGSLKPTDPNVSALSAPDKVSTGRMDLITSWILLLLPDTDGLVRVHQLFSIFTKTDGFKFVVWIFHLSHVPLHCRRQKVAEEGQAGGTGAP